MIGKPKSAILMAYVYMASFGYPGILGRVPTCTKSAKRERYKSFIYGRVPISMYVNLWHGSLVYSSVSMATFGLARNTAGEIAGSLGRKWERLTEITGGWS